MIFAESLDTVAENIREVAPAVGRPGTPADYVQTVAGLPAGLALFPALGCALARAMWTRGPVRILALAVAFTLVEWLRGHILTGFPWNTYGYALTGPLVLAQTASLFGIWGLTFLAVGIFASPATLTDFSRRLRGLAAAPGVYLMRDAHGNVIYVGKAMRLRDRVLPRPGTGRRGGRRGQADGPAERPACVREGAHGGPGQLRRGDGHQAEADRLGARRRPHRS
jgi:hypothetical protein